MSELVWQDPPAPTPRDRGNRTGRWKKVVAQLKERPGEWALVAEDVRVDTAVNLNRGLIGGVQPGEVEAVARNRHSVESEAKWPTTNGDIYARYVGSNGDKP